MLVWLDLDLTRGTTMSKGKESVGNGILFLVRAKGVTAL